MFLFLKMLKLERQSSEFPHLMLMLMQIKKYFTTLSKEMKIVWILINNFKCIFSWFLVHQSIIHYYYLLTYLLVSFFLIWDDFEINPISGDLNVKQSLDREKIAYYEVIVNARDHGIPVMSSNATIRIQVLDVNDNTPVFAPMNTSIISEVSMIEINKHVICLEYFSHVCVHNISTELSDTELPNHVSFAGYTSWYTCCKSEC